MEHNYFLIAKYNNKSFAKYRGILKQISEVTPKTYDELWVGVKKHPEKTRHIVTFRDEQGNIIERAFDFADGKQRNRVYSRRTIRIDKNETVNSVAIKDYYIRKRVLPYYEDLLQGFEETKPMKNILWNLKKIITNHTSINKLTGEKVLSQVKIDNLETPAKQRHTFIEFPHIINNKISKEKKKFLSFDINGYTDKIIPDSTVKQGVRFPKNDTYLAYRALSIEDSKGPLTRKFIKERKLQKAHIEINSNYYPENEDDMLYAADFNPVNGSINFNRLFKPASKTRVAGIAKHETEHGWQYFLRSRFDEPTTEWEYFIKETFGKLKFKKLIQEAKRYTKAIKNYTVLTKELEDSGKVQEYRDNYIEVKASKAGEKIRKEYDKQGKVIRNNFKHIPKEYL